MTDANPGRQASFEPVVIALDGGRTLEVRALGPADVPALIGLYEALDETDRRYRFFSAFRPSDRFVRRWISGGDLGGLVLGAFVRPALAAQPDGTDRPVGTDRPIGTVASEAELVAEAGYARLENGNGEIGITTARQWRGWLGPFLLDVLAGAAHDAGVENLEADIRLDNRPMLTMIGRRGAAVAEQPAYSQVRLVMGTGARVAGWAPQRGPGVVRVLVESPAGRWSGRLSEAERRSLEVVACPGPAGRPRHRCPLLDGGRCPLAEGADRVVVVTGDSADASFDALAAAHGASPGGPPVDTCGLAAGVGEVLRRIALDQPPRRSSV